MKVGDLVTCKIIPNRIGVLVLRYEAPKFSSLHWHIFWHDMEGDDKDLGIQAEDMLEVI